MSPHVSHGSVVDSTRVADVVELPEGLALLDDFDLPSLDDLLQQFPESIDHGVLDAEFDLMGSCCGHTSPCSQTSVGPSAVPGQHCIHMPAGKGALMASGLSTAPLASFDSHCSTGHGSQPADSAVASLSRHQVDRPTSSNDSNPCEDSPESSSDRDGCHKRRRKVEGDAASLDEQEDGGACSPGQMHNEGSRAGSPVGTGSEDEQKRQARMQRNRESAMQSRQRRKMQLEELERRNAELQTQNTHLTGLVAGLSAENAALRHQLAAVQGNSSAPPAMPAQAGGMPMPARMPVPYMPWMPGMPYIGPTPKVAIQRLPVTRPEPATGPGSRAKKVDTKKRARTAAGSTALLALFCFFLFMGPVPFWPGSNSVPAPINLVSPQNTYAALPSAARTGGRVLQSASDETFPETNWTTDQSFGGSTNSSRAGMLGTVKEANDSALNDANAALVLRTNTQTKASALQRLKDLGPVTLYSDWGSEGGVAKVWENTGSVGIRSGRPLVPPMQCREVFSLDASQNVDAAAARRQLQNYLATMSSFRGRALAGGPLAMPPTSRHALDEDDLKHSNSPTKIGCEDSVDDVVVSIMLPAQQPEEGTGNKSFASLDEVYVVVVKPMNKYVTYACSLENPILV